MTTPAAVLTASTSSGTLTGITAALAVLTATDAAGVTAVAFQGLLNESAAGSVLDESTGFILTEDGG